MDARSLVNLMLPSSCLSACHIYFPDPWPKTRHHKNRLINEQFPALARAALAPGGKVFLRTDDAPYFAQMTEVFGAAQGFERIETPADLSELLTDFERDFHARGIKTRHAAYSLL